jgi:hypothetical protein
MEEQTRLFGTDHLYAADSFIEMAPPSGDLDYLARLGRAIHDGMAKTDPRAVWLLQGWTFFHQRKFWTPERIKAFLDAVPNQGMLILDLFCEKSPVWNQTEGFFGKPWVWSFVYNFGNNTVIGGSGPLERIGDLPGVRAHPLGRNLRGVGLIVEGLGHNPPLYDLFFEQAWREGPVDLPGRMREFARQRYGREDEHAAAAWDALLSGIYSGHRNTESRTVVTSFPGPDRRFGRNPAGTLATAWRHLILAGAQVGDTETYRHDLVNVGRQYLAEHAGRLYDEASAASRAGDAGKFRTTTRAFLKTLGDLDELLATDRHFLLGRWLEDAKRWGETDDERARMEWNARRVLTLWGGGTALRDYAWKEWSGMIGGFYSKRWDVFFRRQQEALDTGRPFDAAAANAELLSFENEWAAGRELYPAEPQGDALAVSRRLYDQYVPQPLRHLALGKPATFSCPSPPPPRPRLPGRGATPWNFSMAEAYLRPAPRGCSAEAWGILCFQALRRVEISFAVMSRLISRFSASMVMGSPFFTMARGRPSWASGVMWPTTKPWLPPEKRPSVMSATSLPRPLPITAEVGLSISRMPGPPVRALVADDDDVALLDGAVEDRGQRLLLGIVTRALPVKARPSLPLILATAPPGARLPRRMTRWLSFLIGLSKGRMISCPAG